MEDELRVDAERLGLVAPGLVAREDAAGDEMVERALHLVFIEPGRLGERPDRELRVGAGVGDLQELLYFGGKKKVGSAHAFGVRRGFAKRKDDEGVRRSRLHPGKPAVENANGKPSS